jgi:hypothetical protein
MSGSDLRQLKREFDEADPGSTGYIGPAELRSICIKRGLIQPSEEDIRAMLLQMDANNDGHVSFREFCAFHHRFADPARVSRLTPFLQQSVSSRMAASRPFTAPVFSSSAASSSFSVSVAPPTISALADGFPFFQRPSEPQGVRGYRAANSTGAPGGSGGSGGGDDWSSSGENNNSPSPRVAVWMPSQKAATATEAADDPEQQPNNPSRAGGAGYPGPSGPAMRRPWSALPRMSSTGSTSRAPDLELGRKESKEDLKRVLAAELQQQHQQQQLQQERQQLPGGRDSTPAAPVAASPRARSVQQRGAGGSTSGRGGFMERSTARVAFDERDDDFGGSGPSVGSSDDEGDGEDGDNDAADDDFHESSRMRGVAAAQFRMRPGQHPPPPSHRQQQQLQQPQQQHGRPLPSSQQPPPTQRLLRPEESNSSAGRLAAVPSRRSVVATRGSNHHRGEPAVDSDEGSDGPAVDSDNGDGDNDALNDGDRRRQGGGSGGSGGGGGGGGGSGNRGSHGAGLRPAWMS